jgi:outer membrane protein OmpA-like peptidoglycan-associated protein
VTAVTYTAKGGEVDLQFLGTDLLHAAKGKATVKVQKGVNQIQAEFSNLVPASRFGPVYLTYVLWAITPEGRSNNLGELELSGSKSKLNVTTRLQSFAMIVTAEPYFAVSFPSEQVILYNVVPPGTKGTFQSVQAKGELFLRGNYNDPSLTPIMVDSKTPLALAEAENAVRIAKLGGAEQYAGDTWTKAMNSLNYAQGLLQQKKDKKLVISSAKDAVQTAEDARMIAARRIQEEKLANERAAAAAQVADEARKAAEAQAQQAQAELAAAQAAKAQAEADAQRMAAELQQQQAQAAAAKAQAEAAQAQQQAAAAQAQAEQAEKEKEALRQQILQQLNQVLVTVDTPRGLVATMADVLFDSGKYNLRQAATVKLAKLSGIILSHPGLNLSIQGYTDNVGSDDFNMQLSQKRADEVRTFLIGQGISPDTITAQGMGKADPVASNDSAVGREQNRRVEIVVSGDVIGVSISPNAPPQ